MSQLARVDIAALRLVKYPDPVLRELCQPVTDFDASLRGMVERMFELMYTHSGVGLAAPQVGVPVRLFVANPTLEPGEERVYINPELIENSGTQDGDEGCLSFPGIFCKVKRYDLTIIRAQDTEGQWFEESGQGLLARIFQHECDHLDGRLLVDRMSAVGKIANRRALKELEEAFAS